MSFLTAKKQLPPSVKYKVHGSCRFVFKDGTPLASVPHTTNFYSNKLNEFVNEFIEKISVKIQSDEEVLMSSLVFEYSFILLPSGRAATTSRKRDDILNKKSVLQIINNDNNCFWYGLICLLNPTNRSIRDKRNTQARIKPAMELCKKCKLNWNEPISFLHLPLIEEKLDCNIYVIDLNNIPFLDSNINIWNNLMYKSENKNKNQYYFLYDNIEEHYDCIINIKGFLATDYYCNNCLRCFQHKNAFDKHECNLGCLPKNIKKNQTIKC